MRIIQAIKSMLVICGLKSYTCAGFLFWAYFLLIIHGKTVKRKYKDQKNKFAESSKEEKYEKSCMRSSYIHNDTVSRKPIAQ